MDLSNQTWLRDTDQGEMGENALNPKRSYPNILMRELRGKMELGNQGESSKMALDDTRKQTGPLD